MKIVRKFNKMPSNFLKIVISREIFSDHQHKSDYSARLHNQNFSASPWMRTVTRLWTPPPRATPRSASRGRRRGARVARPSTSPASSTSPPCRPGTTCRKPRHSSRSSEGETYNNCCSLRLNYIGHKYLILIIFYDQFMAR